jgi:hypothetical protein
MINRPAAPATERDYSATAGPCQVDPMHSARNRHLVKCSP